MDSCLTCRLRKKGCPCDSIQGSCNACARLHLVCGGQGLPPPPWSKAPILITFYRRIVADQRRLSRNHTQSLSTVAQLVNSVITRLYDEYGYEYHLAYGSNFDIVAFFNGSTEAVGIHEMRTIVQDEASRLGYSLAAKNRAAEGTARSGVGTTDVEKIVHPYEPHNSLAPVQTLHSTTQYHHVQCAQNLVRDHDYSAPDNLVANSHPAAGHTLPINAHHGLILAWTPNMGNVHTSIANEIGVTPLHQVPILVGPSSRQTTMEQMPDINPVPGDQLRHHQYFN
ncbi:uncharacterized protein EI90DRAFT_3038709 [Cantharellus anzutake]|uniref:uncharacterized protein n=1 Tax=Cantharellus anzutake TaxID=1750568 RepID=UPI0019030703|nr:uncharacterized protein EI90DRAFT_3038709 [Cantharellus anzutake]KAF8339985.1 hypothetical protein EI90DRAFT_3038709 [Cantharellus anzutake]